LAKRLLASQRLSIHEVVPSRSIS